MEHLARVARHRLLPLLPMLIVTLVSLCALHALDKPSTAATAPVGLHAACIAMPVSPVAASAAELGNLDSARVALFATLTLDFAPHATAGNLQREIESNYELPHRAQTPLAGDVLDLESRARGRLTPASHIIEAIKWRLPTEVHEGSSGHVPLSVRPISGAEHRATVAQGIPRTLVRVRVV